MLVMTPMPRLGGRRFCLPLLLLCTAGCMAGPNFSLPPAPTAPTWIEGNDPNVQMDQPALGARWWEILGDPALNRLVQMAYAQNLSLRAAGLRVLEAQARRGIAIGSLFPQEQRLNGAYTRSHLSQNTVVPVKSPGFSEWRAGFDASWELDFWGKFRRAIEASDAELLGSVAAYDDVLVGLISEVASAYVQIRVLDERLAVASDNVRAQLDGFELARIRFEVGGTSELDVQQAATLLHDTEASIPQLELQRRQTIHSLCVLLGLAPSTLSELLGDAGHVPQPPVSVTVGIPADLLRRRPDVRRAEQSAAAQSARIGVAAAEWYPSIQLRGNIAVSAENAADLFEGRSFAALGGPQFVWPVLNYGRIHNNVRLQDAAFQEQIVNYAETVLRAEQEVEDALAGFLRGRERVEYLAKSLAAANRAVDLSLVRYREGGTDYTSVLNSQQAKLREDDALVSTRGAVVLSVIALYKAVDGGWELRDGNDFVGEETRAEIQRRGYWGSELDPEARAANVSDAAQSGWSWRHWWPQW